MFSYTNSHTQNSFVASSVKNARLAVMLACLAPFLAGVCGLRFLPDSHPYARLACLWVAFTYTATWTLSMAVATANVAGHTKKITTNAVLLIGYCLGNFVGPFFFKSSQAPGYDLGVAMMFFCIAAQAVCLVALGVLFRLRNRRRYRSRPEALGRPGAQSGTVGHRNEADQLNRIEDTLRDETDLENKSFKVG